MNNLSLDKQNEFAFKAIMILEIENNLMQILNSKSLDLDKQTSYKVQVIYNASELKKYATALNPYKENEKVRTFFDGYNKIKENLEDLVKRISTKEILKEVKKFSASVEEKATEMEIEKLIKDITSEYGISEDELKVVNLGTKKKRISKVLLEFVVEVLLSSILMFSLIGLFSFADANGKLLNLVLFSLYYGLVEGVLKVIVSTIFRKYILKTFGLILIVPFVICTVLCTFLPIFITIKPIILFIVASILVFIVRKFIISYVLEKILALKFKKKEGK